VRETNGQIFAIPTLGFQSPIEEQVRYTHADIINDLGCFSKIGEPAIISISTHLLYHVDSLSYHVMTCAELDPNDRKLRKGKIMVMAKHHIGTYRKPE
jgi:hypothetical protein